MTLDKFFDTLTDLVRTGNWRITVEHQCIRLERGGVVHTPLTAVYCYLTGGPAKPCFLVPEMVIYGMNWSDVIRLSYAEDACDTGGHYDRGLRKRLLSACGLSVPFYLDQNR